MSVTKSYDLEERTLEFAKLVSAFVQKLPKTVSNHEDAKQLVRSSGSVGANYIEANESLSKKDKLVRMKISRKEAKESAYWLKLIGAGASDALSEEISVLIQEANELTNIFGAICLKLK